jgi:hypothetical protein
MKALDGTDFGSASLAMGRHNRKLQRSGYKAPASSSYGDDGSEQDQDQPQPITDNQDAMECVDKLQQMGYTADDVAQAFESLSGEDQDTDQDASSGAASTQAAPLQIPGLS